MEGRERWQALQARLTAARTAADRGDRGAALAEITAALELDPDFLAAHALRDRLLAADAAPPCAAPAAADPSSHGVSAESYAKFQDRAKRRRLDGRIMAARAALARGRLSEAAAALDEVIELDPRLPELSGLTADFDALRRSGTPRRGPWIAASGAFAATILAASWLQDTAPLASRPMLMAGLALPARAPVVSPARDSASVATTGTIATTDLTVNVRPATTSALGIQIPDAAVAVPPPAPANPIVPPPTPIVIPAVQPPTQTQSQAQTQMRSQTQNQTRPAGDSPAVVPAAASIPSHVDQPDDGALVQQTLQRYRRAYDGLDARSAQAVWPAVNEAALARAFDGLESQTLTFDGCEVHMFTATATATCQGSARYVPKVGNREPRVEPRTWTFALRKDGGDWKIDSARVER